MFRNRGKEKIKSIIAMLMTVIMTVAVLADAGIGSARTVFADTADTVVKSIKAVVSDGTGDAVEKEVVKDGSDNFIYINKYAADINVTINPDIAQDIGATQIRIGSDIKPIENDNDTLTFPITSLSNGTNTINVQAIDNAAVPNVKETYTLKVIVDDTDPIINSAKVYKDYDGNLVEITDDIWMNAQPIIKIEAEDTESGVDINSIKCDYYKQNADGEEHVEGVTTTVTEESGSYKVITAGLESGEYTLKITLNDKAGNTASSTTLNVKYDNENPTISIKGLVDGGYVKPDNEKITVTAKVTDNYSGVKQVKINNVESVYQSDMDVYKAEIDVPADGKVTVVANDNAGNSIDSQISNIKKDVTAPVVDDVKIVNNTAKINGNTYVQTVNGKIIVTANVTDTDSGVKEVKVNDSTLMTKVGGNLYQAEVSIPENGEIKVTAIDNAGNEYVPGEAQLKNLKADITAPTVENINITNDNSKLGEITYVKTVNGKIIVTANVTDTDSGVKEVKVNDSTLMTKVGGNLYQAEVSIPENGEIKVTAIDNAGNEYVPGEAQLKNLKADITAPTVENINITNDNSKLGEITYVKTVNGKIIVTANVTDTDSGVKEVKINDVEAEKKSDNTYSAEIVVPDDGKIKVIAIDNVDNESNNGAQLENVKEDIIAPTVSITITPIVSKFIGTKDSSMYIVNGLGQLEYKIEALDDESNVDHTYYYVGSKKDDIQYEDITKENSNGNSIEFPSPQNGMVYYIYAYSVDKVGNISDIVVSDGTMIDTKAPEINISETDYFINSNKRIEFSVTENNLNTVEINDNNGKSVDYVYVSEGNKYSFDAIAENEGKKSYHVTATDKAGNISGKDITVTVDITAPVISDLEYTPGTEWTNKIGDITFTYADVNGANEISGIKDGTPKATYDINGETKELEVLQDGESYVIKADNLPEGSYLVTVTGQDIAGNKAEAKSIRIKKDVTNPVISEVEYTPGTEWTNESGDITFKFSDKPVGTTANEISGIDESTLRAFYKVNNIESEIEITGTNGTYRIAYDKLPEGSYTVYISGNDMVGNKAETQSMSIKKDITKPVISNISYEPGTSWTNKTGDIQFEIADPQTDKVNQVSGVKTESVEVTYKVGNIERILKVGSGIAEANGKYVIDKADLYEGSYTVKINCVDIAGNKAVSKTINIKKDTTVPSGTIALDGYNKENPWNTLLKNAKYGIFQRKVNSKFASFTVTYKDEEAKDNHSGTVSGVKNAEYIIANSKKTQKELSEINKWEIVSNNIIEIPDAMYAIVYVKITDNAGNVKYISSDGVVFDDTKPMGTLEVKNYTAAQNDIFNEDVVIKYSIDDSVKNAVVTSAIKEYKIVVSDETNSNKSTILSEKIADENYSAAESANFIGNNISRFTGEVTINSKDYNSNKITVTLSATDNAGNEMEVVKKEIMIDVSAPEVNISYDNNKIGGYDTYFDAGRTMNIVVTERNFNEKDFKLAITKNGVTQIIDGSRLGGWTYVEGTEANGDGDVHSAHYSFNDDADYEIEAEFTDKASNICKKVIYTGAAVQKFTVDKTKPVINVVSPEGYASQLVNIPITINEHNFEPSDVNVFVSKTLDGKSEYVDKPVSLIWSDNGDIHSSVLAVGEDGDYTFTVSFKDKAGNNADNYTSAKFSVDNVDPELWCNISAENKNLANKGNIEFQYVYTDVNAESNLISYKVSTLSGEEVAWEPEITEYSEDGKHGYKLVFTDAVDSTKLGDGIYVISVTVKDKANRMATDTKTVSVNRHGSTYDFYDNSYIAQINGGYVKSVEQNIEVRVQNYDEITQYQVSIFNSLNEQIILQEGTDFSWKLSDESTDGCKIYTCIINKSIFEENGTYTVQISAKDSADDSMYGDKASMITNKDADNGKVISFTVDDIAPEIAISGVKDGENYDNATDIKLDYSDANKIDSITVQRVSDTGDIIDSYEVSNEDIETAGEKIGRITYTAQEYNDWQTVKFAVTDIAGNTANAEVRILVTSNGWIKFVNNRPLFIGSIVGLVVLLGVIVFVIIYNKKKKTTK